MSGFGSLEHHVQEHGVFRNILVGNRQMAQRTRRSLSRWVGAADGWWGDLLLFLHTSSLAARGWESYMCKCHQINAGFLFKVGSFSNSTRLMQVQYHLGGGSNPAKQQQCPAGRRCQQGCPKLHEHMQWQLAAQSLVWWYPSVWSRCNMHPDRNDRGSHQTWKCMNLYSQSWLGSLGGVTVVRRSSTHLVAEGWLCPVDVGVWFASSVRILTWFASSAKYFMYLGPELGAASTLQETGMFWAFPCSEIDRCSVRACEALQCPERQKGRMGCWSELQTETVLSEVIRREEHRSI